MMSFLRSHQRICDFANVSSTPTNENASTKHKVFTKSLLYANIVACPYLGAGEWYLTTTIGVDVATHRQRIIALFTEGVISKQQYNELLARERRIRGGLDLVKTKLGESFSDFRARAYDVATCRGDIHWWERCSYDLGYRPVGAVFTESRRCVRCQKVKITVINALGRKDRHIYIDPIGFKLDGVRTTKDDWKQLVRYMDLGYELDDLESDEVSAEVVSISVRSA